MLEFVALAVLRVKAPAMPRPFRIPGGLAATIALGIGPAALIAFALWTARGERVAGLPAPAFAALIALLGAVVYALRPRRPPTH